jgi:late competence protein required for DNA uptake (superfamily II DNA/RNA helicase)
MTTAWPCNHATAHQTGRKHCIRCCTTKGLEYVSLRAAGGTPARFRYLCPDCLSVYEQISLVARVNVAFSIGGRPASFGGGGAAG